MALTGTGLDRLPSIIRSDRNLDRWTSDADINAGARAAENLNTMLVNGIKHLGLANDGEINAADMRAINDWVQNNNTRHANFVRLHGDDEGGQESGFHLVAYDGATTTLFGRNAVNGIADKIYNFGFDIDRTVFRDEDGNRSAGVAVVADWVDRLLTDQDMIELRNPNVDVDISGTTGTGLDRLVNIISNDHGLNDKVSTVEIAEAAKAADEINHMIMDAVDELRLLDDGKIDRQDVEDIGDWFQADSARYNRYVNLHGDDYANRETGFKLVDQDGGMQYLFGRKAVDSVADAIYNIGYDIRKGHYYDEDGIRRGLNRQSDKMVGQPNIIHHQTEGPARADSTLDVGRS